MPDDQSARDRVVAALEAVALRGVVLALRYGHRRERSEVWHAVLASRAGDARLSVFVYDLTADPAGVVDVAEEHLALTELARVQPGEIVPELVAEGTTDGLAVLVAAPSPDAATLRRYLAGMATPGGTTVGGPSPGRARVGRQASPGEKPAEGVRVTYHPQLDRLFGADTIAEVNGRLVARWLMSRRRLDLLSDVLHRLAAAIPHEDAYPFPVPVAAYQLDPAAQQVEIASLEETPREYDQLALLVVVLPPGEPLGVHPILPPEASPSALATGLFRLLATAHALPAVFSRAAGCATRGEFVTADGAIVDSYYLTGGDELGHDLERARLTDVANSLQLLCEATPSVVALQTALVEAIGAYAGAETVDPLRPLVCSAAATAGKPLGPTTREPITVLARAVLGGTPR